MAASYQCTDPYILDCVGLLVHRRARQQQALHCDWPSMANAPHWIGIFPDRFSPRTYGQSDADGPSKMNTRLRSDSAAGFLKYFKWRWKRRWSADTIDSKGPNQSMNTTRVSLLARLKELDQSRDWREFDSIYRPLLRRYAGTWGLQPSDADEVAQQCLLAFWSHLDEFNYDPQRGKFRAWLRRLVDNNVRTRARRPRELRARSRELAGLLDPHPPAEEVFDKIWLEEHMRACLEEIREEVEDHTFRAFELYVIQQMSVEDVCHELGITANQVYKSKWRVTQMLGARMKALEP